MPSAGDSHVHSLIDACNAGHLDPALYFAFHLQVSPFSPDETGRTALIAACKSGHTSIVCALVLRELFKPTEPTAHAGVRPGQRLTPATHAPTHVHTNPHAAPHPMSLSLDTCDANAQMLVWPTITVSAALHVEEGIRKRDKLNMSAFDWAARFGHTGILSFLKNICPGVLRTWRQQELFGRQVGGGTELGHGGNGRSSGYRDSGDSTDATFGYGGIGPTGVYSLHIHNDSRSLLHFWDRHNKYRRNHRTSAAAAAAAAASGSSSRSNGGNGGAHKGHPMKYHSESNWFWYWFRYLSGKMKLHACFSGNRWLSSYVPYLTTASFGTAFVLTASYATVKVSYRNFASLLAQALLFCMIHRVRNGNPGYISRHTLRGWREGGSGDGTGAIAGHGDGEDEGGAEEEEEEPPHDRDEYLFSLWLYYNSLQDRSAALAQQHSRVQSVTDVRIISIDNHSNSGSGSGSSNGNDGNMHHHHTACAEGSDSNGGNSRVYHHHHQQQQQQQQQEEEEEEEEDFSGRAGASTRTSATSNNGHSATSNCGSSSSRGSEVKWRTGISCNVRHYCCHICRCTRLNLLAHKQQQQQEQERISLARASASASAATIFIPPSLNVGHSHQTHRCVTDFDHYCIFLGTDIAQQNYRMFLICTILLVMVVFPLFISATTEHVGRMSQMKREYLQSLRVIHAHMDPLHLDTNEGIDSNISKDSTHVKSGADMLKDYQKPLFLQAFLVWTLMVWMQMFFLMCFHLYCKFWRGVKARNVLQTIRSSGSQLVQQIVGVEVIMTGAVGAGGRSGGDGAGAGASEMGYNV